jgi:NTP pyrophosphatase (non-canonical NTP hydrolase)
MNMKKKDKYSYSLLVLTAEALELKETISELRKIEASNLENTKKKLKDIEDAIELILTVLR